MPAYFFAGADPTVGRWTMVFFSSLVAPVLFLVVRKLLGGRGNLALMVAAAWVLYPPSIFYSTWILTETTSALLTVGALGAFLWAAKSRSVWPALLTGALWALLALNRSVYLLVPLALLVAQVVLSRFRPLDWNWSPSRWALGIGAFVLVMAPWTVRNYVHHGVFMPHSTQSGTVLMYVNGTLSHPLVQAGAYYKNAALIDALSEGKTEVEQDGIGGQLAVKEIKRNWRLLPRPLLNRAKNFWTTRPDPYDPFWTRNDWIMLFIWGPVLALFLMCSFIRSWRQHWPALVVILYAFLVTLPFWGTPRFRFPVDAIIITGAGVGFVELLYILARLRQRLSSTRASALH